MRLDEIASSGIDEFYTPITAIFPLLSYIKKGSRVWCPFDKPESLFNTALPLYGLTPISTHIETGHDFFFHEEACDVIISNPPYSLKTEVFTRLFDLGKPFAMLVGVAGLFEGPRFRLFRNNPIEVMWFDRRVAYMRDYLSGEAAISPPFSSVWLCSQVLPSPMVFETLPVSDNLVCR